MAGNFDSWEDDPAAQEDNLSQQTRSMNLNPSNTFRPGAGSFQPGATSFQPQQNYVPQNGAYGGYQSQQYPQYNQQQQYPQYGQQQQYPQYNQQQQQYPQYNQQAYQPPQARGVLPSPSILQKPKTSDPVQPVSQQPSAPAAPQPALKTKVLSIGVPSAPAGTPKPAAKPAATTAPDAAAEKKTPAKMAVEKTQPSPPSSGKSSPAPPAESKKIRTADEIAQEQSADVDEETLKEMYGKEHVNLIFIGHVDAGKSTLSGQILYLTGMVDERTLDKYKRDAKDAGRESWYISWIMDLNKEERAKGKTVEVGRGFFETEKRRYSILDAPGHKTYVPNMIGGASQADVGVLVISARKGEYETGFEKGGQTREHAVLAKTQGVNKLIIAVNKMDDNTVEWKEERFNECITKLTTFLKGVGYKQSDLAFIPISAQTGIGIKEAIPKKLAPWNKAPSLLEYLDSMEKLERKMNAPFMMPVGAKYRDMGTMVEGKIEAGVIQKDSKYVMMPNREEVSVAALYGETEDEIPHATCGDQVRMRLRGIEEEDIMPGFVLCSPKRPVHCVRSFEAQVHILPELKSILSAGFNCVLHVHAAIEEVTFAALLHKLEPKTGRKSKKPPPFAAKGQQIIARLEVTSGSGKVCVERFTDYAQMGRFTLRDQGQTIAIGKITKLITEEE